MYRSRMLQDRAFKEPVSRTDLVTRLINERRYVFGVEEGMDGRRHMGIDVLQRTVEESIEGKTKREGEKNLA